MVDENRSFPWFEIHFLDVGDADCIVIWYKKDYASEASVALIDAGNVSNAVEIKKFLKDRFDTLCIDLAVCTHPDSDHKGGFFELLEDEDVVIREFWLKDPLRYVNDSDFARMRRLDSKIDACRYAYNHPSISSKNLIDLISSKRNKDGTACECYNVSPGDEHDFIPIKVLGPLEDYYRRVAIEIVGEFTEVKCELDTSKYDELEEVAEESAKSVIDTVKDESPTNKGSLILCFQPKPSMRILLAGDAAASSLRLVYEANKEILSECILKVPHHGSKHNLNSSLIDDLKPSQSIISAAGTKKHPSSAIVRYLSKYGNVYSTHKSGRLYYTDLPSKSPATPLKKKNTRLTGGDHQRNERT